MPSIETETRERLWVILSIDPYQRKGFSECEWECVSEVLKALRSRYPKLLRKILPPPGKNAVHEARMVTRVSTGCSNRSRAPKLHGVDE